MSRISVPNGPIEGDGSLKQSIPLMKEPSDHYSLADVEETVTITETDVPPKFIRNPSDIIGARKLGRSSMMTVSAETSEERKTRVQIEWQIGLRDSMNSMEDLTLMKSPEFDAAYDSLMTWTAANNLNLASVPPAKISYPEYITVGNYVAKTDAAKPLTVNFRIPSTGNEVNSAGVSTMFALKSTVADMIKYVQGKFQYLGIALDETKLDNYIPKIVGEKEYLLHLKIPIGMYDSVVRAERLGEQLNVVIVKISDSEKEILREVMNQTERQYIEHYLSVRGMKIQDSAESAAIKNLKMLLQSDGEPTNNIFASESENGATKVGTVCLEDDVDALLVNNPEIIKKENCDADLYIRVEGISFSEPLNYISFESFFVEMCLYCNDEKLCEPFITQTVSLDGEADGVRYLKVPTGAINFLVNISVIPPATRVTFALIGNMDKKKGIFQAATTEKIPVAGAAIPLFDFKSMLSHTTKTIGLFPLNDGYGEKSWRFKNAIVETKRALVERISSSEQRGGGSSKETNANYGGNFKIDLDKEDPQYQFLRIQSLPTAVLGSNLFSDIVLNISFNSPIGKSIVCTKVFKDQVLRNKEEYMLKEGRNMISPIASMQPSPEEIIKLKNIEFSSTLNPLTPEERRLLWEFRHYCVNIPQLLPKFLRAVQWKVKAKVDEARVLLYSWKTVRPSDALELLDIRFSDNIVREYAVEKLNDLNDVALSELLLQLTQVLKYESYHDSALLRFLLKRAILSPLIIGQPLYWMLRSEMYVHAYQERLGLLLSVFLIRCGGYRDALYRQLVVNESIRQIAEDLKLQPSKSREDYAKRHLEILNATLPTTFSLCLNPRIELKSIKSAKCKVMTSKKLPLWLVFQNSDENGDDYYSIYKAGDDLRQDQLTLQLIRIMDTLWRDGHGEMPESCDVNFLGSEKSTRYSESRHNVHQLLVRAQHKRKETKSPSKGKSPAPTSSIFNAFSILTGMFKPKVVPPTEAASPDTRKMHENPLAVRNGLTRAPPSSRMLSGDSQPGSANSSGSSVHHHRRTSSTQIIGEEIVEGLDLRMKPYRCVSTGYQTGMIEIVMNSQTLANIQTEYGGVISGAFSTTTIKDYLKTYNPGPKYKDSADNFSRTCAGYCVATYVLGIGDRHADNIMVSKHGHIFHIDFGHFLGNFKSKFGINRERSPFVFTPEMAAVLTNKEHGNDGAVDDVDMYLDFEEQCCRAFNILRRRNSLLLNLFTLMLPASMPDLLVRSDVQYSVDMLSLDLTDDEANEKFIDELDKSLSNISRRLDNLFHNVKHKR